jgi:hypothetical protein
MNNYDILLWMALITGLMAIIASAHAVYEWLINRYAPDDLWLPKPEIRTRRLPSDYEVLGEEAND